MTLVDGSARCRNVDTGALRGRRPAVRGPDTIGRPPHAGVGTALAYAATRETPLMTRMTTTDGRTRRGRAIRCLSLLLVFFVAPGTVRMGAYRLLIDEQ